VGPESLIGSRVLDLEVPFTLTPVDLPPIEPVLPDAEYPRAALVVPAAKDYNRARRLLRQGDLNGAEEAITDYLSAQPDGRLSSAAHYMHGEIQHRLARGALIRDSLLSARILEKALKRDPRSPNALRARLMLAQDLTMAGMQSEAGSKFADMSGVPEEGSVAFAFRIGGAALAANQGDTRRARELMRPLWRDTVPREIGALARFIEGSILYGERACDRVVPMLAAAIRLDQRVSDQYPEADMMLAECLAERGRFLEATDLYDAIVRREPPAVVLPAARVRQGDMLYFQGDPEAARNDWLAVMAKFNAGEALGMARMRLSLHPRTRSEVARSLLNEASQASGSPAHEARYRKALFLLRRGDWVDAVRVAEDLINAKDAKHFEQRARNIRSWSIYQLFAGWWGQGDDQKMAESYLRMSKWLRTHPSALRLHRAVAKSFKNLHLPEQVVKSLQSALGRYEGTAGEQSLLMDLAEAYIRINDGFRAGRIVKYLETYVVPDTKDLRLAEVKARAFAASGQTDDAVKAFEDALKLTKLRGDRIRLLASTGQALKVAVRYKEAAKIFRRCRKLDRSKTLLRAPHTSLADCHFGLGDSLYELGKWGEAGKVLARAADHHPDDRRRTTARSRAGLAYRRAHKLKAALTQFKKLKEAAEAQALSELDPDSIGGPGIAGGDTAEFWNRIATRAADDTLWDLSRAEQFKRLMETHE
jgi:tetratricopeptide (TPR) repeat protein